MRAVVAEIETRRVFRNGGVHREAVESRNASETFVPTVMLGFVDGKLHQAWVGVLGTVEWRMVDAVDPGKKVRVPAVVGAVSIEEEGDAA